MGWLRFNAWLRVMHSQLQPTPSDNAFAGPEWDRMRAERDALRGVS